MFKKVACGVLVRLPRSRIESTLRESTRLMALLGDCCDHSNLVTRIKIFLEHVRREVGLVGRPGVM